MLAMTPTPSPQPDIRFNHIRIGCSKDDPRDVNPARLGGIRLEPVKPKVRQQRIPRQRRSLRKTLPPMDDPASPLSNGSSDSMATSPDRSINAAFPYKSRNVCSPFDTASAICAGDPGAYAAKRAGNARQF